MTSVLAVHAVGESLRAYLDATYPAALRARIPCAFQLVASGQLTAAATEDLDNAVTLYLYRVTLNEHVRTAPRLADDGREQVPLSLDLHYLVSVWAKSALVEHTVLAWVMRQLHQRPVLDRAALAPADEWGPGDVVQVLPAELGTEQLMRVWDALDPAYRLSVSYVARAVRIDADPVPAGAPVVARRLAVSATVPDVLPAGAVA